VPEKKKRKIIKSKGKKQKAKEDKHETLEKKKQKMVKIMKPQANSKVTDFWNTTLIGTPNVNTGTCLKKVV
jgi:hypothetical protein